MGSKPSKVSPSRFGLRGQTLRGDASLLNNVLFPSESAVVSLVQKPALRAGVPENGFITPRSRGRSAIYSMARTPYSSVHPTATPKVYFPAYIFLQRKFSLLRFNPLLIGLYFNCILLYSQATSTMYDGGYGLSVSSSSSRFGWEHDGQYSSNSKQLVFSL